MYSFIVTYIITTQKLHMNEYIISGVNILCYKLLAVLLTVQLYSSCFDAAIAAMKLHTSPLN